MQTGARFLKRSFDVVGATALMVPASLAISVFVVLVRLRSRGPVLFRQVREGENGEPFVMFKIRTMRTDAEARADETAHTTGRREEWLHYRRLENDPRIIAGIGRWLRQSSMDELPQLFNVLRGEMSLIGPRPLELGVIARLPADQLAIRRTMKPGMTGLAQVSGRSEHDIASQVVIDIDYVRNWSLALDLRILFGTPAAVLSRRGAY